MSRCERVECQSAYFRTQLAVQITNVSQYCQLTEAVAAGAKVTMLLADTFWGDRYAQLEDPFGPSLVGDDA
jgi:uncharacterized glyoxalase superfamily protein PhnB